MKNRAPTMSPRHIGALPPLKARSIAVYVRRLFRALLVAGGDQEEIEPRMPLCKLVSRVHIPAAGMCSNLQVSARDTGRHSRRIFPPARLLHARLIALTAHPREESPFCYRYCEELPEQGQALRKASSVQGFQLDSSWM